MKEPAKDDYRTDTTGFRERVLGVVSDIGLQVSSLRQEADGSMALLAEREDSLVDSRILVYVGSPGERVEDIGDVLSKMEEYGVGEAVLVPPAGISEEASRACAEHSIKVVDLSAEPEPQAPGGGGDPVIYERVFADGVGYGEARRRFERSVRRSLLGFGRRVEAVKSVVGRYAPIACFKLKRVAATVPGSGRQVIEGGNLFWVNMSDCNLYYAYHGIAGRGAGIRSSNILRRLADLPEPAVRIFSRIVLEGRVEPSEEDREYGELLHSNASALVLLENLGLVAPQDNTLYSNVNIPGFGDTRYDISRFLESESSVESTYPADEITYPIPGMLDLLRNLFGAEGSFEGVTYMPYYMCTYESDGGGIRVTSFLGVKFNG